MTSFSPSEYPKNSKKSKAWISENKNFEISNYMNFFLWFVHTLNFPDHLFSTYFELSGDCLFSLPSASMASSGWGLLLINKHTKNQIKPNDQSKQIKLLMAVLSNTSNLMINDWMWFRSFFLTLLLLVVLVDFLAWRAKDPVLVICPVS